MNHYTGVMTANWISNNLLRPFLFFITLISTQREKVRCKRIDSMKLCFTVVLESLKSSGISSYLDVILLDLKLTF